MANCKKSLARLRFELFAINIWINILSRRKQSDVYFAVYNTFLCEMKLISFNGVCYVLLHIIIGKSKFECDCGTAIPENTCHDIQ